jgi:hypothetical protein
LELSAASLTESVRHEKVEGPMRDSSTAREEAQVIVGGRYLLAEALGEGGVAVVHRARDTATGRDVALKHLRVDTRTDKERAVELFRQEFHTLSQLVHPRIVSVYDYGVADDGAPYYTMELLDGGDLLDRVPCEWRTACALARDVCSVLSLIHSRRMVYRDLSPKNVRCTSDGRAKLLDFGALSPMGPAKLFVGTPAVSAPEAVHLQPLDARTDLYSLGATLYFALTGRRPYPANGLAQLYELWQKPPPPPSAFTADLPPALDSLVMELLQLDAGLRPSSAAETLDRLSGIAGLERDESAQVASSAYLSTPTLVGRDTSLERFRRRMKTAFGGSGGSVLVRGVRGVGRTRFLDACVLEAKIAGAIVLRADASDAIAGEYGVARALAAQLVEAAPELARACAEPRLETLRVVVPALRERRTDLRTSSPAPGVATAIQPALREWFTSVAEARPLFIALDDADRVDLPSLALVALLAREATGRKLIVGATLPSEGNAPPSNALKLLIQESRSIALASLSAPRAERLLRSLFGDVPNVQMAAHRLHAVSNGLPRDLIQLAQHLVDRGLARYSSGSWSLPQHLDAGDLPADMAHARRAKVDALSPLARRLAQAFALGPTGRYTFGECVGLSEHGEPGKVMSALDELIQTDLVALSDKDYSLSSLGWRDPLVQSVEPSEARNLYLKLAAMCEKRPGEGIRVASYLLDAGEERRGLDALVAFSAASVLQTAASMDAFARLVQSLPDDWLALFDRGLDLCRKYERPAADSIALLMRVNGIASQLPFDVARYFGPLIAQLTHDAGLDIYATLDDALPPLERIKKSLALAAARHKTENGKGSVMAPDAAVHQFGQTIARAIGSVAATLSVELLQLLPSLAPLVPLSAALASWETLVEGVSARILGQSERARRVYERQLARISAPDHGGLEATYHATQLLGITHALGMLEAAMGLEKSLERAKQVESSPLHEVNAIRIRMLYALWQGDVAEADRHESQAELLSIERARRQTNEGGHLLRQLLAHAVMDDLTRVKRMIDAIEPLALHAAGWRAVLEWANAEYQRIRGNNSAALEHALAALSSMHPAGHPIWSEAAATHVRILVITDRCQEAKAAGLAYLAEANRREIGYERTYIRMPLAVALARLGETADAVAHADGVIRSFAALGATGLNLGLAYETRARVALFTGAEAEFEKYLALCATRYGATAGPLAARYERLVRDARLTGTVTIEAKASTFETLTPADTTTRIAERLGQAQDPRGRAQRALELLLENSGAAEGFLLGLQGDELVLKARIGQAELSESMLASARRYLAEQCRSDEITLVTEPTETEVKSQWTVDGSHVYRPVVLSHEVDDALAITGLALLRTELGGYFRHPATTATQLSRLAAPEALVARVLH